MTQRMAESIQQRDAGLVSYATVAHEVLDTEIYLVTDPDAETDDPIAYAMKASSDPDTMYYHKAMKAPDARQFRDAMLQEVQAHTSRKHWKFIEKASVLKGEIILPAVWAMRRKRRIATRQVYKWKSRLNLGGHKMVKGKHYGETYAPVVMWTIIRLLLTLAILFHWHSRQIDFVLAYPQADILRPTFMELPRGVKLPGYQRNKHCIQVLKNIYGGKDSGRTWFLHLKKGLEELGFVQSRYDECVFFRGTTIFMVYTDDGIFLDPYKANVDKCLKDMEGKFIIEDQGNLADYLGVQVSTHGDGTMSLTQPHLIDNILMDLGLLGNDGQPKANAKGRDTPAQTTVLIEPDLNGADFDYDWDYRSVIGKLNFLEKSTRFDIAYAVHQCARFSHNPKRSHGEAVKRIGRYLLATRKKGYTINPDMSKTFDCWVDADFCGLWNRRTAPRDPNTARSRTGFILQYAGVPLYWQSKLQTQIALSTAESELIALSHALRHAKYLMFFLGELQQQKIKVHPTPTVHCRVFEDNAAALEIARVPKLRPRTRHINVIYHHFRDEVANKQIQLNAIGSKDQYADTLTKATPSSTLKRHRRYIMGW